MRGLDPRIHQERTSGKDGLPGQARQGRSVYSAALAASDRLSSDEMTCSASASASGLRSCGLRTRPMRHEGSSGNPSAAESTRMPGRSPDSGTTETASPDNTAAQIALALPLE